MIRLADYSSLFFAVVSLFAFIDLCALRDLALAVFVLAVFALLDLAADFADFLVVSCFVWPACWAAACACTRGATASMSAATAAASVRRFMQLPPEGVGGIGASIIRDPTSPTPASRTSSHMWCLTRDGWRAPRATRRSPRVTTVRSPAAGGARTGWARASTRNRVRRRG